MYLPKSKRQRQDHPFLSSVTDDDESSSSEGSNADDEDDQDCQALTCKQPTGNTVTWVQCETCFKWLHLTCIGIDEADLEEDTPFTCKECEDKKTPTAKQDPLP